MDKELSNNAKNAVLWLMSDQARGMKFGEARAAILEGFGELIDKELQEFFISGGENSNA